MDIVAEYARRAHTYSDISLHLPFLYSQALGRRPATVIELGVRTGNSTSAFLAAGADLWSVDIRPPVVPAAWHDLAAWHFLMADDCDGTARGWLPAVADIVFIDTEHTYDQAMRELEIYVPRVRPGGAVLMHDTQFADGADLGEPAGPVACAIRDYCGAHGLSWENRPGSYGLGVIAVPVNKKEPE